MLLNFDKLVLRMRNDGGYVEKVEKGWLERDREFYLSVENPIDPSLDVGKSSYNIKVAAGMGMDRSDSAPSAPTRSVSSYST